MTWLDVQLEVAAAASTGGGPQIPGVSTWLVKYRAHVASVSERSVLSFSEFRHQFQNYLDRHTQINTLDGQDQAIALMAGAKLQGRLGVSYWGLKDVPLLVARVEDLPKAAGQGVAKSSHPRPSVAVPQAGGGPFRGI